MNIRTSAGSIGMMPHWARVRVLVWSILGLSISLTMSACDDGNLVVPDQAADGPEVHKDIPLELIPLDAAGGDPRGVYAPNRPLFPVFMPNVPGVTITEVPLEKIGAGTVTFEGDSPSEGTYTTKDWFLSVRTTITFTEEGQSVTFPVDASGVFIAGEGTWATYEEGLMVLDGRDSIDFTVDLNGMYLYRTAPYFRLNGDFPPVEVPIVKVLKK
jgi:hypothetical protein